MWGQWGVFSVDRIGGGSKSSKTSTPVTATFPEMHRSRSARGADSTMTAPKRSHKKGASISGGGSNSTAGPSQQQSLSRGSPPKQAERATEAAMDEENNVSGPSSGRGAVHANTRNASRDEPNADHDDENEDEEEDGGNALEPRYCYCDQVSYGSMVACDAKDCPREWFHLNCVGLTRAPGKNGTTTASSASSSSISALPSSLGSCSIPRLFFAL